MFFVFPVTLDLAKQLIKDTDSAGTRSLAVSLFLAAGAAIL
jgi:hypothetical protein